MTRSVITTMLALAPCAHAGLALAAAPWCGPLPGRNVL